MEHALLLNPFNLNQGPIQNQGSMHNVNRRATRSTPVCRNCQSDDIIAQTTAQWSNEAQAWELANTFGLSAHCNRCNAACEITWLPRT
jgi:hypothetical protein